MSEQEIADKIDGMEYGEQIPKEIIDYAKEHGVVIVFGASDDLMEFRGVIDDEICSYGGGMVYLNEDGIMQSECSEECPYFQEKLSNAKWYIEALWCDVPEYSWTYKTNISHATFDIVEDGDKYCRGIVFSMPKD